MLTQNRIITESANVNPQQNALEVANRIRVGVMIHDNPRSLDAGWAFLVNEAPIRVRGLYDLKNDVLWISSGRFDDFKQRGSAQMHHVRRTDYLGIKLDELAADLGIRIDGQNACEGGAQIVSFVEQAVKSAIVMYGLSDPLRQLQDDSMIASIKKMLPQALAPKAMMATQLAAAYQSFSACYQPFMDNTVSITLRFDRFPYAKWLLDKKVPDNSWSLIPDSTGFKHDDVMDEKFPPTLINGVLEMDNVSANMASLIAFGCGVSPAKKMMRRWMTDVEYRWISRFARVHVTEYFVAKSGVNLPELYKLPEQLVGDPLLTRTVSSGIIASMHWHALVAQTYVARSKKNEYDPIATWIRAHDRAKCFEAAKELSDRKFHVTGYGNGAVYVKVDKERFIDLSETALELGFAYPRWNALLQKFGYASAHPD